MTSLSEEDITERDMNEEGDQHANTGTECIAARVGGLGRGPARCVGGAARRPV